MAKIKNFRSKLEIACSKDDLRPVMGNIIFVDGYAVCTNAHILVKQHLSLHDFDEEEIEQMNGKCIDKDTFKEINRYEIVTVKENHLVCTKGNIEAKFALKTTPENYPNYKAVIPALNTKQGVDGIGFSMNILKKVSDLAINSDSVEFAFFGKDKAILVKSVENDWDKETILVMPKRV